MLKIFSILYMFTAGLLSAVPAASNDYVIRYLTPQDGLLTGNIRDIAQDSSGVMWFATSNGVISYDGYTVTNFRYRANDPRSLPTNICNDIFVDSRGVVWIATNKGICFYNEDTRGFVKPPGQSVQPPGITPIFAEVDSIPVSYTHLRAHET